MHNDKITIIITSSPCKRHPSMVMIQETIRLLRLQLSSKILILLDGVKPEQEHLREAYEEYKINLQEWLLTQDNIETIVFDEFQHQTGMIKHVLKTIDTEQLLFIEHDFPLVGNIPWQDISVAISRKEVNLVRFYLEDKLIPEHRHMFLDQKSVLINNVPLIRISQWSQRPHIASTSFYKNIVKDYLKSDRKIYIEDAIHGYFAYNFDFKASDIELDIWQKHKLAIYCPEGNISRCIHLDGRMEEKKYGLE